MTTVAAARPLPGAVSRPSFNLAPIAAALTLIAFLSVHLLNEYSGRQAALFLVGTAAGLVLYHAAFGFTSSWRAFIAEGRGGGIRAQMLMLAITCAVFLPAIASGSLFGQPVRGSLAPVGVSVAFGAFLFGIGMQLGGGCASGTLYSAGGGSVRMLVTLSGFIAGSVLGAWHLPIWENMPAIGSFSLLAMYGAPAGVGISLALFGLITAATLFVERRRRGGPNVGHPLPTSISWLRGPWPLVAGALGLAAVNIATLALAGRPWGVTSALALWGSKMLQAAGADVASWPYWQTRAAELQASVFNDITSVMNFGIILGALAAAGLAGRFAPVWRVPLRSLAAALIGGVMLGYGARIAYGCNIGAYFSGIASSSLHGWLWFAAAFAGNTIGTRIRPAFGLKI